MCVEVVFCSHCRCSLFPQKASKEPIPEEQELDFRPSEEGEDQSEQEESDPEEGKELDRTARKETERREGELLSRGVTLLLDPDHNPLTPDSYECMLVCLYNVI